MIKGITTAIIWYIGENPGVSSTAICHQFPEQRHSVTSALVRLTKNGTLKRSKDSIYRYTLAPGVATPAPPEMEEVIANPHKPNRQAAIVKAMTLESKCLYYRAATEWQKAWDLTGNMSERTEITRRINRCNAKAFHPAQCSYAGIAIARYVG
ncbi:hypothetical protein [Buttiauxella izardii]|uniref:PerC family transcriptional regulator n=1 Tax=Buttiauxella izardii TaxID=82991 RepID=A0A3A5JV28_9ENTR|nr:hypothetical protein [Buttiauxella izardii]RJT26896.1 hypothetical protein D6029_03670 [Buttiauxella izardii]